MNKAEKKLVNKIDDMLRVVIPYKFTEECQFLNYIKKCISNEKDDSYISHVFDYYKMFNDLLLGDFREYGVSSESFTPFERGYLFDKMFQKNYTMINSLPYSYIEINARHKKEIKQLGFTVDEFNLWFAIYLIDPNLKNYKGKNRKELIEYIKSYTKDCETTRICYSETFKKVYDFAHKKEKNFNDCIKIKKILEDFYVPGSLIEDYLYFHMHRNVKKEKEQILISSNPKKEESITSEESLPIINRKKLKEELNGYFSVSEERRSFDYIHFERVMYLLAKLNYADEKIKEFINRMYQKAIFNYSYYAYLFNKKTFMNKDEEIRKEILEVFSFMMICDDDEYEEWKKHILELLEQLNNADVINNCDYEFGLIKKNRK